MNEQAYKYVAELIHELYEEKLKAHRYRCALEEARKMLLTAEYSHEDKPIHKDSILASEILDIIDEVLG